MNQLRAGQSGVALRLPPQSRTRSNRQWFSGAECQLSVGRIFSPRHPSSATRHAFSLLEVLVVVSLLSLIVIALMSVFSGTQTAFRASITQTDILEGGRATVDLITSDLRSLAPSGGVSNGPVNFVVLSNLKIDAGYKPMFQGMTASPSGATRENQLNFFFALGRENTKWTAVGYAVNDYSSSPLYPLYRFYAETNITASPTDLYVRFYNDISAGRWTNMSHVVDGVVDLKLRAYDPNGIWINNYDSAGGWVNNLYTNVMNTALSPGYYPEAQLFMFSNTVPAAVDLEIGVLEDRALARAESRGVAGTAPFNNPAQWSYLTNQIGALHLFHQRVNIPNVDTSAYQP